MRNNFGQAENLKLLPPSKMFKINDSIGKFVADKLEEEFYPLSMNERITKLEAKFDAFEKSVDSLRMEISNIRWWILGACLTTLIGVGAIVIAFGQYQASWFQQSLDRNWEMGQKAMDKIDATMLRMERLDAEQKAGKTLPRQVQPQ